MFFNNWALLPPEGAGLWPPRASPADVSIPCSWGVPVLNSSLVISTSQIRISVFVSILVMRQYSLLICFAIGPWGTQARNERAPTPDPELGSTAGVCGWGRDSARLRCGTALAEGPWGDGLTHGLKRSALPGRLEGKTCEREDQTITEKDLSQLTVVEPEPGRWAGRKGSAAVVSYAEPQQLRAQQEGGGFPSSVHRPAK